jgi:hypothetical protein
VTSFDLRLGSMAWRWYARIRDGDPDPVLQLIVRKSAHHELLTRIGAPHAHLLHTVTSRTITVEHLAGLGVMALVPDGDKWRDDRGSRVYDLAAILDRMRRVLARDEGRPDEWLVEELLQGRPERGLVEYGCYTFAGTKVPLIRAGRTWKARTCKRWFTPDGEPVEVEQPGWMFPVDDTIPPPDDIPALLSLARSVASAVPVPFMRVDTYDTSRGLVVGETNPTDAYRNGIIPHWDAILGGLLDEAVDAQGAQAATARPSRRRRTRR